MDFKQLEAFVYVVKLKSFSKAAQRIYLTQPTISAHINSLEKELDTKLIERGTKYVYPTKPGSILYQYAIKMLNLRDDACCSVKNYNKELKGTLSICASTVPSQYILPKVVSAFREEYMGRPRSEGKSPRSARPPGHLEPYRPRRRRWCQNLRSIFRR